MGYDQFLLGETRTGNWNDHANWPHETPESPGADSVR